MVYALSPQYSNREEFLRSVEHVRKEAHNTIHWATYLPTYDHNEPFEVRVARFNRSLVTRAVDVALEGLMEILDRPNLQFIITNPHESPKMSNEDTTIEAVTDGAAQHLIAALASQRPADAGPVADNADLTVQEAYDLGMRGTLVALDNIGATVSFTKDELSIGINGGLAALFDGINS